MGKLRTIWLITGLLMLAFALVLSMRFFGFAGEGCTFMGGPCRHDAAAAFAPQPIETAPVPPLENSAPRPMQAPESTSPTISGITPTSGYNPAPPMPSVPSLPSPAATLPAVPSPLLPAAPECGLTWAASPGGEYGPLHSVAAISSDDVWAVGYLAKGTGFAIVKHWDGHSWLLNPLDVMLALKGSKLYGVSAASKDAVWATGSYQDAAGLYKALVVRWNGKVWSQASTPALEGESAELRAVKAISRDDVWAVGYHYKGQPIAQQPGRPVEGDLLIEHWDGSSWTVVPAPALKPGFYGNLTALAGTAGTDVWAAGYKAAHNDDPTTYSPLAMHWDGKAWAESALPSLPIKRTGTSSNAQFFPQALYGVAAIGQRRMGCGCL